MGNFFDGIRNTQDIRSKYLDLMKIYHPDVTSIKEGATEITQEINEEYQMALKNSLNIKDKSHSGIVRENLYLNVYMAKAHIRMIDGIMEKYFKMECVKSYLINDQHDGERLISNLKMLKTYNLLTNKGIKNCDRNGHVLVIESGGIYLTDFISSDRNRRFNIYN